MNTAGLFRRGASVALDALVALAAIAAAFAVGIFDAGIFRPEAGWFWTEWWLRAWLDDAATIYRPIVWWVLLTIGWVSAWELATGRTPGDRIAGLEVVDASGDVPHPLRIALRTLGMLLNVLSFGLGWLWGFVSPARRALHDILSQTYVVPRSRP